MVRAAAKKNADATASRRKPITVQGMPMDNLIEMDFGTFEGKSADELVHKPEFKEWLKGGMDCRPPQGGRERQEEMRLRIFRSGLGRSFGT